MYCIKCGVELADGKRACPLCGTSPYHPHIEGAEASPTYPPFVKKEKKMNRRLAMLMVTIFYLLTVCELLLCDVVIAGRLGWSIYAAGGMALFYVAALLPLWFKKPNPVIFIPCAFVAAEGYLLLINCLTGGGWFLSFVFPVVGIVGLIVTAVATLIKYLKKGYLFIIGGAIIALGAFTLLVELFSVVTFNLDTFHMWSVYPAAGGLLFGGWLIAVGACRPLQNWFAKKFFI